MAGAGDEGGVWGREVDGVGDQDKGAAAKTVRGCTRFEKTAPVTEAVLQSS